MIMLHIISSNEGLAAQSVKETESGCRAWSMFPGDTYLPDSWLMEC